MLLLTRRRHQSIMIGDDICIQVLGIMGHHVELGITAPKNISVHREEVFLALKEENKASAQTQWIDFKRVMKKIKNSKKGI